eukprot:CAMPEP_0181452030 /NCGR_PEP_ID=MMETSP1110-20121109/28998_1 /TAXON_ID=174948 /ORGANISM="Symbiodinium sp., Strain CCMP421" /LENGTH=390 /DNA_ID=CAMNT_0023576303 /DNA_START=38 /DNA_END=1210 /DNA_ORIENTATION=+
MGSLPWTNEAFNAVNMVPNALNMALNLHKKVETPSQVATVSLQGLRRADPNNARALLESLRAHGFAWLNFEAEDPLTQAANAALPAAGAFLASKEGAGAAHAMQGHFSTKHKDGLRLATGSWLPAPSDSLEELMVNLAAAFDAAQKDVVTTLANVLWGQPHTVAALASMCDLPLLAAPGLEHYGLLDVVRYRMGPDSPDEVVSAHVDPGLLIMSLPSSAGLELKTGSQVSGSWLAVPPGLGVLWTGAAAQMLGLPSGLHRVVASPERQPRVSAWHEICTRAQLCEPMLRSVERANCQLKLGGTVGTEQVLRLLQASEDHDAARSAQLMHRKGVPVGKSGVRMIEKLVPLRADELQMLASQSGRNAMRVPTMQRGPTTQTVPSDVVEVVPM